VLGIACRECPPCVVHRTLGVAHSGQTLALRRVAHVLNREQGNGVAGKTRQVALKELCESPVGSPLQSVIKVVIGGRGEPGRHAQVRRVSGDVHVDLTASTVRWSPLVAEMVEHVPEQGRKTRTLQPVTTEPSIGPEGHIGVVVHLSKTRKK
jgi:hypothetical protein